MPKTKIILIAACGLLSACTSAPYYSGDRFVPRPNIQLSNYTQANHYEDFIDRVKYNNYEQREQCQRYRRFPRNSVEHANCLVTKAPAVVMAEETVTTTTTTLLPIVQSYTIYFNFDRSGIRGDQNATLDQVAREIAKYDPSQITVTGYTDTSGKASYNQKLSEKRAASVIAALQARNISSQAVDENARGEYDLAVSTPDGVKLQENRRVVIDFRR